MANGTFANANRVTPRFITTSGSKDIENFVSASIHNTGSADITITNSKGEVLTLGAGVAHTFQQISGMSYTKLTINATGSSCNIDYQN